MQRDEGDGVGCVGWERVGDRKSMVASSCGGCGRERCLWVGVVWWAGL